jgi:hypothetical protein
VKFKVPSVSVKFNGSVKIDRYEDRIMSNADVLLLREADCKLELTSCIADRMVDLRNEELREGYGK